MPAQSSMRKSTSSKRNILPYLRSASSKLNISALASTSSLTALFTSAAQDHSNSSSKQSMFANGIRGLANSRDKENENSGGGTRTQKRTEKGKKHAYPEISAPTLSDDALAAVKARFTLIPINKTAQAGAAEDSDEGFSIIREESVLRIESDSF